MASLWNRTLTISSNEIRTLPESFQTLTLDHIDVFGNPFEKVQQEITLNPEDLTLKVATLRAISAKSTIKFKLVSISIYVYGFVLFFVCYFTLTVYWSCFHVQVEVYRRGSSCHTHNLSPWKFHCLSVWKVVHRRWVSSRRRDKSIKSVW